MTKVPSLGYERVIKTFYDKISRHIMNVQDVEMKLEKLPDHIIPQVIDYIEFLLNKYGDNRIDNSKFKFDWEGGLSNLKSEYTSVELQHKASEWQ